MSGDEKPMSAADAEKAQRPKGVEVTTTKPEEVREHSVKLSDLPPRVQEGVRAARSAKTEPTTTAAKKERKASKAQRQQATAAGLAASGKTEFQGAKTIEELTAKHNEMVLTAVDFGLAHRTVKTFIDVKTGVLACERLHAHIEKARSSTKDDKAQSGQKETSDMATKKTTKSGARKAVKGKTKAAKTGGAKRERMTFGAKDVVTWNASKKNPFREKSGKWKRVEAIRTNSGKSVADIKKKGARGGTIAFAVKNGLAKVAKTEKAA